MAAAREGWAGRAHNAFPFSDAAEDKMETRLTTKQVGVLTRDLHTPDGQHWWSGSREGINFWICCPERPSEEQLNFAQGVLDHAADRLREARRFLAESILRAPDAFGIDERCAQETAQLSDDELPFDLPELSFYPNRHWQVRFPAGRRLPAFESMGVAVVFEGNEPIRAMDLSASEPLE
jgi:hypothetical protein